MRSPQAYPAPGILLTTLVVMGCASTGTGTSNDCRSALLGHVDGLGPVLDSAALSSELGDLVGTAPGLTVAEIPYDSSGMRGSVQLWSATLDEGARTALSQAIANSTAVQAEPRSRISLVLADERGVLLRRLEGVRRCAPSLLNGDELSRQIAAEARGLGIQQQRVARLQLSIDPQGSVGDVQVYETSGRSDVDIAAARVFQAARFDPARVEGIPVGVSIRLPVTFTPR